MKRTNHSNDLFDNYIGLLGAVIRQAAQDYLSAKKALKNPGISDRHRLSMQRQLYENEKFLRDNPYLQYLELDGQYVMENIEHFGIGAKVYEVCLTQPVVKATAADRRRIKRRGKVKVETVQPCWSCTKACDGDACCWARGVPRSDWKAKKIETITSGGNLDCTYAILKCPAYEREV